MDEDTLSKYRLAGRIARESLQYGIGLVREGERLLDVADKIEAMIVSKGARPAFPVNIAINDVAAHFTPRHGDKLAFQRGELVKLDVGAHVDGYIGDTARTVEVGTTNQQGLIAAAERALANAISSAKPNVKTRHLGRMIEHTLASFRVKPITNLTGHSLEKYSLHAGKSVPNTLDDSDETLVAGDVLAIEPFSTTGSGRVDGRGRSNIFRIARVAPIDKPELRDFFARVHGEYRGLPFSERWCFSIEKRAESYLKKLVKRGVVTPYPILCEVSGAMVAQAEHTIIVTEGGNEVIT